ncbi:tail assembly chaperone [Proteus phage Stubb]|uniref:Tape measure chaperone n=1 Tax=Proteus phage Stubb TaxID=2315597 RepID=A0A3B8DJB0_9CAUD|nr:tail assembly chaperone [Proteus phage Stubb]AYJ73274.1 tape measure chaperone [Proteus phage Stubb]
MTVEAWEQMKQMFLDSGRPPPPEDSRPIEFESLDTECKLAFMIFNRLRDTYVPGQMPQYNGKDLSGLPVLFEIYGITDNVEKEEILDLITILDGAAVKTSADSIKKAIKRSSSKTGVGNVPTVPK